MRSALLLCFAAALSFADGTKPKPAPTDYDVHGTDGPLDIGAEYMVHSYSNGEQMFLAERYLVVEIALFPVMKTDEVTVDMSKISLRLNNKTSLQPVDPKEVAASLKPSPWSRIRNGGMNGGGGAGPLGIPFPGGGQGPYPPQQRVPNPPRAPEQDPPGGIERTKASPEEVLLDTALPPGQHKGAVSGFVYFPYRGKSSSLKSVELEYSGVTLKLK
jgi:hypothetical protein